MHAGKLAQQRTSSRRAARTACLSVCLSSALPATALLHSAACPLRLSTSLMDAAEQRRCRPEKAPDPTAWPNSLPGPARLLRLLSHEQQPARPASYRAVQDPQPRAPLAHLQAWAARTHTHVKGLGEAGRAHSDRMGAPCPRVVPACHQTALVPKLQGGGCQGIIHGQNIRRFSKPSAADACRLGMRCPTWDPAALTCLHEASVADARAVVQGEGGELPAALRVGSGIERVECKEWS